MHGIFLKIVLNVIRFYLYGEGKFIWGGKTIYKNSRVVVVKVFVFQKTKIVPIIVVCNNKKFFVKII